MTYAKANLLALGLAAGDMTTGQTAFNTDFADHIAAKAAAMSARQAKVDARTALTAAIRPLVRRLQASPLIDDAERAALSITVAQPPAPVGAPTTAPLGACGQRLAA